MPVTQKHQKYIFRFLRSNIAGKVEDITQGLKPKDLGVNASTINFYLLSSADASLPFNEAIYSINCRGANYGVSQEIADTVISELNRELGADYFLTFSKLPPVFPLNEEDNYNSPVECKIRNT